jgi:hypothetical protein
MTQKIDLQYVRFDTAKLLKEKGFANIQIDYGLNQMLNQSNPPEQWQVVEWLRVNHGIWIYTRPILDEDGEWIFQGYIKLMNDFRAKEYRCKLCREPQEATEAGILYVLNDLI